MLPLVFEVIVCFRIWTSNVWLHFGRPLLASSFNWSR